MLEEIFSAVKEAGHSLTTMNDLCRNLVLQAVADRMTEYKEPLLEANAKDLEKMDKSNPLYDRLQLTSERISDIAADMRRVSELPSPLGRVLLDRTLPNDL